MVAVAMNESAACGHRSPGGRSSRTKMSARNVNLWYGAKQALFNV